MNLAPAKMLNMPKGTIFVVPKDIMTDGLNAQTNCSLSRKEKDLLIMVSSPTL
jgi:hypothetical protein